MPRRRSRHGWDRDERGSQLAYLAQGCYCLSGQRTGSHAAVSTFALEGVYGAVCLFTPGLTVSAFSVAIHTHSHGHSTACRSNGCQAGPTELWRERSLGGK